MATVTTCWLLLLYVVFWQSYMTSNWTSLAFKLLVVFLILHTKLLIGELKQQMPDLSIYHNTNKNDTNTVVCKKTNNMEWEVCLVDRKGQPLFMWIQCVCVSSLLGDRGVSNTVGGRAEVTHAPLHWVTTFVALSSSLCHMFLCAIACQGVTVPSKEMGSTSVDVIQGNKDYAKRWVTGRA